MAETPQSVADTEPSGRLGLRLASWYAVVFVVTSLAIILLTYRLLEASLVERDQQLVVSTLREYTQRYAEGGLDSLAEAVDIEQRSGRQERLFVRVVRGQSETFFLSAPDAFNDFDVSRLRGLNGELPARRPCRMQVQFSPSCPRSGGGGPRHPAGISLRCTGAAPAPKFSPSPAQFAGEGAGG